MMLLPRAVVAVASEAAAEAVAAGAALELRREEVLLLLLPAWHRPYPVRCGCTRVGSRWTLTGLPRRVPGTSVPERVCLLPVRPRWLLVL